MSVRQWATISCLLLALVTSAAQANLSRPSPPKLYALNPTTVWDWVDEPWTGDDRPYHAARIEIDKLSDPSLVLDNYRTLAWEHPNDSLALYKWGYAACRTVTVKRLWPQDRAPVMAHLFDAMWETPSPHSYEYDRLRFFVGIDYFESAGAVPLAERLYARNRADKRIAYALSWLYLDVMVPAKAQQSLSIATDLVRAYPNDPDYHAVIGHAYMELWMKNHRPEYAQQVVKQYSEYLNLAPANDQLRPFATFLVKSFRDGGKVMVEALARHKSDPTTSPSHGK